MHKSFTLIAVLLICLVVNGQTRLNKIVFLSPSGLPLHDVMVQSINGAFQSSSDAYGVVYIQALSKGVDTLYISRLGYQPAVVDVNSISNSTTTIILPEKNITLQDITVSASKKNIFKPLSELDIRLRPITNSQEVLRLVPGLFIGQHAGGGKAEQIFLRGFDLDHGTDIQITVDGMPVNMVSHAHGQGYADLHFVIPELIEKVDFNKGSYYADKGNFTTAGYVEFNTKNYLSNNFLKVEGGQFQTMRAVGGINLLKPSAGSGKGIYLAGEAFYSNGFFNSPQDFNRYNSQLKYFSNVGQKSTLSVLLSAFKSKWLASGQIPEREVANGNISYFGAIDDTEGGSTSRYNVSSELITRLQNNARLKNHIYYSRYNFDLYSNFTFFKEEPVDGDQIRQKEARNIFGYNGSLEQDYFLGSLPTQTTIGLQVRTDDINDIELSRTKNRTVTLKQIQLGDINETNAGAFLSQKLMISKKLTVTGAVRYDYFRNRYHDKLAGTNQLADASIVSPKLKVDLAMNKSIQLYFYHGRGFHSNDTRVAVPQNGREILPAAYSTDLGGIFKIGRKLFLQSAIWHLRLDQEFVYVGDEGIVEPSGKSRRYGFDASLRYELTKHLFAHTDINYTVPKALDKPKNESNLPLAPKFASLGGLTYKNQNGFNGSLLYRVMGDRPATEDNSIVAKGYFLLDATINYTTKKWEAGLSAQNLLNTKWKETQFATESQLQNEPNPVTEIHFTPGNPFFVRAHFSFSF